MVRCDRLNGSNKLLELRVGCFPGFGLKGVKDLLVITSFGAPDFGLIRSLRACGAKRPRESRVAADLYDNLPTERTRCFV